MFRMALVGTLTLMAHTALAQDVRLSAIPQQMQASSGGMLLREVVIEGRKLLTDQDIATFGTNLTGKAVSLDDGLGLMRDLKSIYRRAGYGDITVRLDVNRFENGRVVLVVDESRAILRPALENPRPPLKLPNPPGRDMATIAPVAPIAPAVPIVEKAPTAPELPKPIEPVEPFAAAPVVAPELPQVTPLREAAKNIYLIDEGKPVPMPEPEPLPEPVPEIAPQLEPTAEAVAPEEPEVPTDESEPMAPVADVLVIDAEKAEIMEETPSAPLIVAPVEQSPRKVLEMDVPATPEVEAETIVERPLEDERPSETINRTLKSWKDRLFGSKNNAAEE